MKREKYSSSKSVFKLVANILSWTALAILLIIAAFLLYLTISSKIYAKKGAAYEPALSLYTIISPSMHPNLRVYDIIVDKRVDSPSEIQIGDIITFISTSSISSNKTVTHRVVDIIIDEHGNYQYKTKGDNNLVPDSAYAEYNNILGKVLFKVPQLGRIQFFLASRGGWLVVVIIPALYIIIKDILKIVKLSKVNKKADNLNVKEQEREEEKVQQRIAEEERKLRLKEKFQNEIDNTPKENNILGEMELPIKRDDANTNNMLSNGNVINENNQTFNSLNYWNNNNTNINNDDEKDA